MFMVVLCGIIPSIGVVKHSVQIVGYRCCEGLMGAVGNCAQVELLWCVWCAAAEPHRAVVSFPWNTESLCLTFLQCSYRRHQGGFHGVGACNLWLSAGWSMHRAPSEPWR